MFASFKQPPTPWKNIPVLYLSLLPRVTPEWLDEPQSSLHQNTKNVKKQTLPKNYEVRGVLKECDFPSLYKALRM
jgi:hypothetical protein